MRLRPFALACLALPILSVACVSSTESQEISTADAVTEAASRLGIALEANGDLRLEGGALGVRVFKLVSTVTYPSWNASECGEAPADLRPEVPGDIPDTCFFKIIPTLSRLVTFSRDGAEVVMQEDAAELGRFAITSEGEYGGVTFRFNPSVAHVKIGLPIAGAPELVAAVLDGTIKARVAGGYVSIQQDGLVQLGAASTPMRIKYGIAQYRPNPEFKARFQPEGKPKHFYEINHPDRPIARVDFSGDRVFRYRSVGIGSEQRATADEALTGALDYWNRVFRAASGDASRVFFELDAGDGVVFGHDPGFNVVQWMTYQGNAASSGVFQTDPKTGEIFFGNAYISAAFFGAGRDAAGKLHQLAKGAAAPDAALAGFEADYILETVAHEIGHTIGLQHNFQSSNIAEGHTRAELAGVATAYFDTGAVPADLSTSTMEYLPIPLAGMLGRRMRIAVLAHDVQAVAHAYFDREVDLGAIVGPDLAAKALALPYCNDAELETQPGCVQFDHPLCGAGDCLSAE